MTDSAPNTAAIILSGGAGTRLNGADKGLQIYQGKALVEQVIAIIEPQVDATYLCANRNLKYYKSLGFKVITDKQLLYEGPMSGISSALTAAVIDSIAEQLLIVSCDTPHLPHDIRERLQSALAGSVSLDVSVVYDGNRQQNLHCLIRRQAWPSLIDFFNDGGRAMHRWLNKVNTVTADFSDKPGAFKNINTIEQLKD